MFLGSTPLPKQFSVWYLLNVSYNGFHTGMGGEYHLSGRSEFQYLIVETRNNTDPLHPEYLF